MSLDNAEDHREFSRVNLNATASFDLPDGSTVVGAVCDLSMNGVSVTASTRVELGVQGPVTVVFGDADNPLVIRGTGHVVRTHGAGFALHIDTLELEGYEHLSRLLLYNSGPGVERVERELSSHVGLRRR